MNPPAVDGFRMPGEFEPHTGCWMAWPHRPDNWRDNALPAQHAFVEVAKAIAQFEPVTMCVPTAHWQRAREMLPTHIRLIEMASDDSWLRDQGPTFLVNDQNNVRGIDWCFNAWGELYRPYDHDQLIARKILEIERIPCYECPLILEGGAIHVDGDGTCITTEECLLNPNRNPTMNKAQIEAMLCDYLGVQKVIWLKHGLYRDEDTSGHIDNIACYIRPGVIALAWEGDSSDPQYERSQEAYEQLVAETDAQGRRFEVHKIPQPPPQTMTEEECNSLAATLSPTFEAGEVFGRNPGKRMAASYVNFYIANGGIVMPGFNVPTDESARNAIQALFPDRRILQIYSRDILLGGGNIHCITQQQPISRSIFSLAYSPDGSASSAHRSYCRRSESAKT